MKRFAQTIISGGLTVVCAIALAGCTGKASNPEQSDLTARGPITYVQGKDNNGVVAQIIAEWNAAHPDEKVTLKEQSDNANQQHDDLVQNFQAQNANYDVVSVDVVWTAEFAARGWLQPLTGAMGLANQDALLPATINTALYKGVQVAAPVTSDGGLLYYRSDLLSTPPSSWEQLIADCSIARANGIDCYAGQFAQYEGLTVNLSEQINGAGGTVVAQDGTTPTLDTPLARKGLEQLVSAFSNGDIPKAALTFKEEDGRQAFESGKLLFYRNWPYQYSLSNAAGSGVAGKFKVAPLVTSSTLGGHNAAISVFSKHKATAHDFLQFLQSAHVQRDFFTLKASNAPVLASVYSDPKVVEAAPYMPALLKSIERAIPRPVTPFYPGVTSAIQVNAFAALSGSATAADALRNMQNAIASATRQH